MKIVPPPRNSESKKRSSEDVMKIVPPLRNRVKVETLLRRCDEDRSSAEEQ